MKDMSWKSFAGNSLSLSSKTSRLVDSRLFEQCFFNPVSGGVGFLHRLKWLSAYVHPGFILAAFGQRPLVTVQGAQTIEIGKINLRVRLDHLLFVGVPQGKWHGQLVDRKSIPWTRERVAAKVVFKRSFPLPEALAL